MSELRDRVAEESGETRYMGVDMALEQLCTPEDSRQDDRGTDQH